MSGDQDILLVFTTCSDQASAEKIASVLVEKRLAVCVNILPMVTSIYKWKGAVQKDSEVLLIIKTVASTYDALEAAIKAVHSYELPEVIAVSVNQGLPDYLNWIRSEINSL